MQLALLATVADESRTMLPSGLILRQARRRHAPLPCRSLRRCRSPVYRISVSPPTPSPTRDWNASKLPYVEPRILVRDSHTSRKSAPFQAGAKLEPLYTPLQHALRFLRVLLPASSTASLAGHLPLTRCPEPVARGRAYHVPVSADPATTWACPVSTCLSPSGALATCVQL